MVIDLPPPPKQNVNLAFGKGVVTFGENDDKYRIRLFSNLKEGCGGPKTTNLFADRIARMSQDIEDAIPDNVTLRLGIENTKQDGIRQKEVVIKDSEGHEIGRKTLSKIEGHSNFDLGPCFGPEFSSANFKIVDGLVYNDSQFVQDVAKKANEAEKENPSRRKCAIRDDSFAQFCNALRAYNAAHGYTRADS